MSTKTPGVEQAMNPRHRKGTRRQRLIAIGRKMQSKYNEANESILSAMREHASAIELQQNAASMAENALNYDRRRWLDEERIWKAKIYSINQIIQKLTRTKERLEKRSPVIGDAIRASLTKAKSKISKANHE